jgi:hypothetical protein
VHDLPSEHEAVLFALTQPVVEFAPCAEGLQTSSVQTLLSEGQFALVAVPG